MTTGGRIGCLWALLTIALAATIGWVVAFLLVRGAFALVHFWWNGTDGQFFALPFIVTALLGSAAAVILTTRKGR